MNNTDIAYAAGAIDADGCISIKRSTTRMRIDRDCRNPIYSPRISLGQVTPQVPEFLREMFGGLIYTTKPGTRNSRPLFKWQISDKSAIETAKILLDSLKIKGQQAQAIIDLHHLKSEEGNRKFATWYAKDHPNWAQEELITTSETAAVLGYSNLDSVSQAVSQGTLLSAHPGRHGRLEVPKICKGFVYQLAQLKGHGKKFISCPQFVEAQHAIWQRVAKLNKLGVDGTCVNHRTGKYIPK